MLHHHDVKCANAIGWTRVTLRATFIRQVIVSRLGSRTAERYVPSTVNFNNKTVLRERKLPPTPNFQPKVI